MADYIRRRVHSGKRKVTVWGQSVCLSRRHTHRDSPGGSMRRVQRTNETAYRSRDWFRSHGVWTRLNWSVKPVCLMSEAAAVYTPRRRPGQGWGNEVVPKGATLCPSIFWVLRIFAPAITRYVPLLQLTEAAKSPLWNTETITVQ